MLNSRVAATIWALLPCSTKLRTISRVGHVLAGGVVRSGARHQPSLAVHHVRRQPAAVDFLQAADQELQIHNRPNHSQETAAIHDRSADQHDSAGRLATAHNQRLAVIDAAFAGGGVGTFQFALQKSVGSDASRGNAFGLGVQQRGISQVVRRKKQNSPAERAIQELPHARR